MMMGMKNANHHEQGALRDRLHMGVVGCGRVFESYYLPALLKSKVLVTALVMLMPSNVLPVMTIIIGNIWS